MFVSRSASDTQRIATRFATTLRGGEVLLLDGELGAGKTVFVRGLARGLGISGRITSPTFVLMRIYRVVSRESRVVSKPSVVRRLTPHASRLTPQYLVHVDAYRVRDVHDLEAIGIFEWLGRPDTVVAIEWGARVASVLRRFRCIRIALQSRASGEHRMTIRRPYPAVQH